jgi:hypothetical protein
MKKGLLTLLAVASLATNATALAVENNTTIPVPKLTAEEREAIKNEKIETRSATQAERQSAVEQKKEELQTQRCARIQERVNARSEKINGIKENHMSVYRNMITRIFKFIGRLSEQGYDVSKIEADLAILKEKIKKFSTDYSAQSAKTNEARQYACDHSDNEFREKLVEARAMAVTVRADAMEIRKYIQETIIVDIKALRQQKIENVKSTTNAQTNASETIE